MTTLIILLIFGIPGLYIWVDYYKKRNKDFDFKSIKYNISEKLSLIFPFFNNIVDLIKYRIKSKSSNSSELKSTISDVFSSEAKYYTSRQQQHLHDYDETEVIKQLLDEVKIDFLVNININKIMKTKNGWVYNFSPERKIYVENNKFSLFDIYGVNRSMYVSQTKINAIDDFFDTIYKIAKNRNL